MLSQDFPSLSSESDAQTARQRCEASVVRMEFNVALMLSQYECCVCLEHISPPILQCMNAHIFCQTCREQLTEPAICPVCRQMLPRREIRNYPLEQIAVNLGLPFPCRYKTNGCLATSIITDKAKHEERCPYRPYVCPSSLGLCFWSGSREEVLTHLTNVHHYKHRTTNELVLVYMIKSLINYPNYHWKVVVTFNGYHFFFILANRCSKSNEISFKAILFYIGEQRTANRFKYRLAIKDDSQGVKLAFEGRPKSIRNDVRHSLECDSGLFFDEHVLRNMCPQQTLEINLDITENL